MRIEVLEQLTAPGGGSPLQLVSVGEARNREIIRGAVLSSERGLYPIRDGILNLLPRGPGTMTLAQRSNLFWLVARGYEWPWRAYSLSLLSSESFPLAREQALFYEMLGEVNGGLWLDLAASTGLYGRWLAPKIMEGGEVVVVDLARPMLRLAQERAQATALSNISFVVARGEQLPFATNTLNGAVCGGSLNEFGARAPTVLRELARALKPGAVALFMHLTTAEGRVGVALQRYLAGPSGIAFWDREESHRLFAQAGFEVEASQAFGVVSFTRVRQAEKLSMARKFDE